MTMATLHSIEPLLSDKSLTPELRQIAEKVANAERITETEGLLLYEQGELGYLGALPTTPGRTTLAQVCSIVYFAFFFVLPILPAIEKTKPVPERVTK